MDFIPRVGNRPVLHGSMECLSQEERKWTKRAERLHPNEVHRAQEPKLETPNLRAGGRQLQFV